MKMIMWRIRGRTQLTLMAMSVATLILILYRMSGSDVAPKGDRIATMSQRSRMSRHGKMENINEFSTLTQSPEHIAKQKAYEARIMADVRDRAQVGGEQERLGRRLLLPNDRDREDRGFNNHVGGKPLFRGYRVVHLDLKGAPPRVSYYEELFPLLRNLGATGLLVEYEDMFPYSGSLLQDIPAYNAYSKSDIRQILQYAANNKLEVIPLIQTFGHLEFVLKLQKYSPMREVPKYPQVVCPSNNATFTTLTAMVDQMVLMHPGLRYLHIGCDEVYHLGECVPCATRMVDQKWTKTELFLNHVIRMARYVKERHPGVTPLTWDDEFRDLTVLELRDSEVSRYLEPVVWKYTPDVEGQIGPDVWDRYSAVFPAVWIASAFKGATGPDRYVTDTSYHLENHRSWMDIVSAYSGRLQFRGLVVTGWQRYDHFSILCELLPVGLPSLAVALAFVQSDNKEMSSAPRRVLEMLKCDGPLPLTPGAGRSRCSYPGSGMLEVAERLYNLNLNVERLLADSTVKGWLTDYNVDHGYSSPSHVEHATAELDRCKMELTYIERDMKTAMADVYDRHTTSEWVATYIRPLDTRLRQLWEAKEKLLSRTYWPKRPLDILNNN